MKNIFIDGNNLLFRCVARNSKFIKERDITTTEGVSDLWIVANCISSIYNDTKQYHDTDTQIYVVWDRKLNKDVKNWRYDIIPEYKGNRKNGELKSKVHDLSRRISSVLKDMGIYSIFPYSVEADDVINYLKNTLEGNSVIVSVDKDFYQCIDETTVVYNPIKRLEINMSNFKEVATVSRENFVLFKAIMGDTSDNIKGLYRYGKVKAKKLAENWETESLKLDDEQKETLDRALAVIDLNSRPLDEANVKAIELQTKYPLVKKSDYELTTTFDKYKISDRIRMDWDNFFNLKEFEYILSSTT